MTQDPRVDRWAKIVWDYHHMHQVLKPAECLFLLGSNDVRVAEYAAHLFLNGYASFMVFSGGFGNFTEGIFKKPEADLFAEIAIARGVPKEKILIENRSTNTGDNVRFTKALLAERGLDPQSFILLQKPFMERRTYATFALIWPEKTFLVTSPPCTFEDYPTAVISKEQLIHYMIGDLQRIILYPAKGLQIPQDVPEDVQEAYEQLINHGYTNHLIKDVPTKE